MYSTVSYRIAKSIDFELHLSFKARADLEMDQYKVLCHEVNAKPLLIHLSKGRSPEQLMLSKVIRTDNFSKVLETVEEVNGLFNTSGYQPLRVKVEVDFNDSSLVTNIAQKESVYFEWHGKVGFIAVDLLKNVCLRNNAHLSRNALKGNADKRFITLREYGTEETFKMRVSQIKQDLAKGPWKIYKEESEFCIYDSNVGLDAGWLTEKNEHHG